MPSSSLINLPPELIYLIFEYLHKEHITYSFLELNNYFSLIVKDFIGKQFDLTKINNEINTLHIHCCSGKEDIRRYTAYLIHNQLMSLTLIYNDKIVGKEISYRLLNKSTDEEFQGIPIASSLILHLSSMNDLILLKRYSESNYLANGLYMIECISTGEWLTDGKDDLCIMSKKLHREHIFSIKQIDNDQCFLEYELHNEQTQRPLTVLKLYEDEERWISSSILSTHRKVSFHSCSAFIFEKIDDDNQFHIRPCYSHAKRLQVLGQRIIVSLCDNENTPNHRFRLHRIS